MTRDELTKIFEAVLLVAEEPVSVTELAQLTECLHEEVEETLSAMAQSHWDNGRGIVLREVAGGWRLATNPEFHQYLYRFVSSAQNSRLSQAALETLSIVAYRQPVSRPQVDAIRGVSSEGVLKTLVEREMIAEVARDEGAGQAILYGTTTAFLERLGLNAVEDLPPLASFMPDTEAVELMERGLGPPI